MGKIMVGLLLILVGVIFLGDNLQLFKFNFSEFIRTFWPVAVILVGVWMLYESSQRRHRDHGESLVTGFTERKYKRAFGEVTLKPDSIHASGLKAELGMGTLTIDLTHTRFDRGTHSIESSLGMGDLRVVVPKGVAVSAHCHIGAGDLDLFGKHSDGLGRSIEVQDDNYDRSDQKLRLLLKVGLGDIRVTRT